MLSSLYKQLRAPWLIVTLLCVLYLLAVVIIAEDIYTLMTIGSFAAPPDLQPHTYNYLGYDGQAVYYFARYGFDFAPYIDVAPYRAGRMLLPVLGYMLAFGQVQAFPYTITLVNLLGLAGSTFLLQRLLQHYSVSRWFIISYTLTFGIAGALRLTTTEPLAYGLALAGIFAWHRERVYPAALFLLLAGLAKEPTLLFGATFVLLDFSARRFRRGFIFGSIVLLPYLLWQLVIYTQYGRFGVGSGAGLATGFELIPFMGYWRILLDGNPETFALLGSIIGIFAVLPTLWALWQCARDADVGWQLHTGKTTTTTRRWDWLSLLLLVQCLVMTTAPFSTFREPVGIFRLMVGLQIAIILYAASRRQQHILMYSTLWMVTLIYLFMTDMAVL